VVWRAVHSEHTPRRELREPPGVGPPHDDDTARLGVLASRHVRTHLCARCERERLAALDDELALLYALGATADDSSPATLSAPRQNNNNEDLYEGLLLAQLEPW